MAIKETRTMPVAEVNIADFHLTIVGKDTRAAAKLLEQAKFQLPRTPYKDFEKGWDEYLLLQTESQACILVFGKLPFNKALHNGRSLTIQSRGVFTDIEQAQKVYDGLVKEEKRHGMD